MKLTKKKHAQEEMVGFVLIVVLVVVIAVVFLGISLRKGDNDFRQKSAQLGSLLSAMDYYTTNCEIPLTEKISLDSLIQACNNIQFCANGQPACDALTETLTEILENTYITKEGSVTKYYKLEVFTGDETSKREVIAPIWKSATSETETCPGKKLYNSKTIDAEFDELISLDIEVCFLER